MAFIRVPPVLVCLTASLVGGAAPLQFQKVIPFLTSNELRLDIQLIATNDLGACDLGARIVAVPDGAELWQGALGTAQVTAFIPAVVRTNITGLALKIWEPRSPSLYRLDLTAHQPAAVLATHSVRFGFRSFEVRNGQFYLNGRPYFLRGLAINPPGRTIPPEVGESRAFAIDYVRYLKQQNVNIIRLTHDSQVWFEVCDELGMLVFQGQYGAPLEADSGKRAPPKDFEKSIASYQRLFERYAPHPSIVIYVLSNELPYTGPRGAAFHEYLTRAHAALKAWDPTHPYLGNAGYGQGREGDLCDVHRYWGWYYNTFLTYYNLRNPALFGEPAKLQPLTFTECVGAFTGPSGEFNLIERKQLGAQLNWTGHSPAQRQDALRYQSFLVRQATESFRRLRPINPRLAGIMPFTILFDHWSGITAFDQMQAKPAMTQLATSYQPVLLSWELWTPQVYAGANLRPIVHLVNDAEDGSSLSNATLIWTLLDRDGRTLHQAEVPLPEIPYYGSARAPLALKLPAEGATGDYRLTGQVVTGAGVRVSSNSMDVFVAGQDWRGARRRLDRRVVLYDPLGNTRGAFQKLGLPFDLLRDVPMLAPGRDVFVVGEHTAFGNARETSKLRSYVRAGGCILYLQQDSWKSERGWIGEPVQFFSASANDTTYPPASRPFRDHMNLNVERPEHPVFAGLARRSFSLWSDYTGWDQTRSGFPRVFPVTAGFKLTNAASLARTAVLLNYDRGLEGVALCEMFQGAGSIILCGLDLVARAGVDPMADRVLLNLVQYAASLNARRLHPLIEAPIRWGNYASERGVVNGPLNGLLVNAEWVRPPTNPSAEPLTQQEGAWNMRPSDQFMPRGRRPFGPYGYSTASSLKDWNAQSALGTGVFWAALPPGKTKMLTTVRNGSTNSAELRISFLGGPPGNAVTIPPRQEFKIESPLPSTATTVGVEYRGTKTLVLVETRFE